MGVVALVPILAGSSGHVVTAQLRLDLGPPEWIAAKILWVWGLSPTSITAPTIRLCCVARNN